MVIALILYACFFSQGHSYFTGKVVEVPTDWTAPSPKRYPRYDPSQPPYTQTGFPNLPEEIPRWELVFPGKRGALFGFYSYNFAKVNDSNAAALVVENTWIRIIECGGEVVGAEVNGARSCALESMVGDAKCVFTDNPGLQSPQSTLDKKKLMFKDRNGKEGDSLCGGACTGDSIFATSISACENSACGNANTRVLAIMDVSSGRKTTFADIPVPCNTNFGDFAVKGLNGKVIYTDCCVIKAFDPVSKESRVLYQHCDCASVGQSCQRGDFPTFSECPLPTLVAEGSGGFVFQYQNAHVGVVKIGDDGWPTSGPVGGGSVFHSDSIQTHGFTKSANGFLFFQIDNTVTNASYSVMEWRHLENSLRVVTTVESSQIGLPITTNSEQKALIFGVQSRLAVSKDTVYICGYVPGNPSSVSYHVLPRP